MDSESQDILEETVLAFLNAKTWNESKEIVQLHPELVANPHKVDTIFNLLLDAHFEDPDATVELIAHQELLKDCRRRGIDTAFKDHTGIGILNIKNFINWVRPLAIVGVSLFILLLFFKLITDHMGVYTIILASISVLGIGVLTAFILWNRAWQKGLGGAVPMNVQFMIIQAMFLYVVGEWGIFRIARNDQRQVELLSRALEYSQERPNNVLIASLHLELATALRNSQFHDRAESLELAVEHYHQALRVFQKGAYPQEWAIAQLNLANTYRERSKLENGKQRLADLISGLEHFNLALETPGNANAKRDLARVQLELANTLLELDVFPANDDTTHFGSRVDRAIRLCQEVLEADDWCSADLGLWIRVQTTLGSAYLKKGDGERLNNLMQALEYFKRATQTCAERKMQEEQTEVLEWLGISYSELTKFDSTAIYKSVSYFKQALDASISEYRRRDSLRLANTLAGIYFDRRMWKTATSLYRTAIEQAEELFGVAYTERGRRSDIKWISKLYSQFAYCLVKLENFTTAFEKVEQGKTRILSEVLLSDVRLLCRFGKSYAETISLLQKRIRVLEHQMRISADQFSKRDLAEHLRQEYTRLNQTFDAIHQEYPDFLPHGLALLEILELIPIEGTVVAPIITSQGSAVFVVPHGTQTVDASCVIMLDDFKEKSLDALLRGTDENPGWIRAYIAHRATTEWQADVDRITAQMWDTIIAPIYARLQTLGVKRVALMPSGGLQLLPLHAAWRLENGIKRYWLDDYEINYAPSAYALRASQKRASERTEQTALVAGVSEYKQLSQLHYTRAEVEEVGKLFNAQPLLNNTATPNAIVDAARDKAYLHLSCHGSYAWGKDALASALYFADDAPLTLSDILGKMDLNAARLVTLSACETGITDVSQSPDEYVGLPAGFLQAGAAGVVSSLWSVDDMSTALLMIRFYENHLNQKQSPAEALRNAQLWLRDVTNAELSELFAAYKMNATDATTRMAYSTAHENFREHSLADPNAKPFSRPYYWAPFVFYGV
jgi:CHAT domain-containing protein